MRYKEAIETIKKHLESIGYELTHKSESGSMYFDRYGGHEDTFRVSDHEVKSRHAFLPVDRWTHEIILKGTVESVDASYFGTFEVEEAMEEAGVDAGWDSVENILMYIK